MEDIDVFLAWKVFNSNNFSIVFEVWNAEVTYLDKPPIKTISLKKHGYLIHNWSDKSFKVEFDK